MEVVGVDTGGLCLVSLLVLSSFPYPPHSLVSDPLVLNPLLPESLVPESPDVRSPYVRCPDEIYPDVQSPNVRSPDALVIVVVKRSLIALQYCRNGDTRDTCGGGNTRKSWCPSCKRHPPMGAPIPQWATIRVCLFSTHTLYILG